MGFFTEEAYVNVPEVLRSLKEMGEVDRLSIMINSPGGDANGGFQLANRLDKLREDGRIGSIETHAEAIVASAATLVFLKGDERLMRNGSRLMIHNPWGMTIGDENAHAAAIESLQQTKQQALDLYDSVSTLHRDEISEAMDAETYYTSEDAVAAGFATQAISPTAVAACMSDEFRQRYHPNLPRDLVVEQRALSLDPPSDERRARENPLHPANW